MEVSETSDNSGVQKSSEAISESSQEDKQNEGVVVSKEEITKTNEDGSTTTTVVIKKKVNVKINPEQKEQNIEETVKLDTENVEEEIIEYTEGDSVDGDNENVETIVETVIVKKVSSSPTDGDDKENNSGETTKTTTKTITKKKIIAKTDSIESQESTNTNKNDEEKEKVEEEKAVAEDKKEEESKPASKEVVEIKKEELTNEVIKEEPEDETEEIVEEIEVEEEEEEEVEEEEEEETDKPSEDKKPIDEEKSKSTTHDDQKPEEKLKEEEKVITPPPQKQKEEVEEVSKPEREQMQHQQPKVGTTTQSCVEQNNSLFSSLTNSSDIKQNIKNQLKDIISDIDRIIKQDEDKPQQIPSSVQQQQQPQQQDSQRQISSLTTREETQEDGFIKKSETIERNEIQDHGDGKTEVHSSETKTFIHATHPPSVTFYNNLPYQQQQQQHQQQQQPPYSVPYDAHRSMSLPTHNQYVTEQTSSTTKRVDLQKIFTPATDADDLLPKSNRKLYASSAFYSPNLHPTVEDQVELARRISHSLSDISNHQSKGQTMYVNRKKRSVKWVHEGEGHADIPDYNGYLHEDRKENEYSYLDKLPLKLIMNPRGQVRDFSSVRQEYNTDSGLLSPDKCAELVAGLNAPKGKGAELFAKRRKKSEKWIVDETNAAQSSPSGVTPYNTNSPNLLPAYSDVGRQRVQLNMHQDHLTDLYAQQYGNQRVKMVKTPWEAALETGSAAAAFENDLPNLKQPSSFQPQQQSGGNYGPGTDYQSSQSYYETAESTKLPKSAHYPLKTAWQPNSQRDLAYKPSIPQGWNAPPTSLPRELYVPKEIPLDGYNPPSTEKYLPSNPMAYQSGTNSGNYSGNYSNNNNNNNYSTTSMSNYGIQPSSSGLGSSTTKITSEKTTSYGDYGTSYTTDNTTSHYEMTKSFPLSSQTTYESSTTTQRSTGDYGNTSYYSPITTGSNITEQSQSQHQQQHQQQQQQQQTQHQFPISNKPSSFYSAPPTYKPIHTWKSKSGGGGIAQHPSHNFNPSPLPYEKLAKFENPDPDDTSSSSYYQRNAIPIRSPSKSRNLSPSPYLSSSAPTSGHSGFIGSGSGGVGGCGSTTPIPFNTGSVSNKYSPKPTFGGSGNFNKCKNYNTAARGWGQSANCYKPITFSSAGGSGGIGIRASAGVPATGGTNMPYTDF